MQSNNKIDQGRPTAEQKRRSCVELIRFTRLQRRLLSQLARHDARPFPFRLLDQLTFNVHFLPREL